MKLFFNHASPFARKVMVCAHELSISERVEIETLTLSPIDPSPAVIAASALGKIPTLVMDDGAALFDSRAICEYLDSLSARAKMFPAAGPARWAALRMAALGDGICETGVGLRYETLLRPKEFQWPEWVAAQRARMTRGFQEIEDRYIGDIAGVDIGSIAIGCALGYMDFRFPDIGWRDGRPKLTAWYDKFVARPSMVATMPPKA
jgi:glutathione S-transferase